MNENPAYRIKKTETDKKPSLFPINIQIRALIERHNIAGMKPVIRKSGFNFR